MISIERQPVTLGPGDLKAVRQTLEREAPVFAEALARGPTVALLTQPFFRRHRILEVAAQAGFPARSVHMALPVGGDAVLLTGNLAGFNAIVRADPPPRLADDGTARIYANLADAWTTEALNGELLIEAFDEIPWVGGLDPAEQVLIDDLREQVGDAIAPPELERTDAGWRLTKWLVSDQRLVRRVLDIGAGGEVAREDTVVDTALPVPPGRVWGFVNGRLVPVG